MAQHTAGRVKVIVILKNFSPLKITEAIGSGLPSFFLGIPLADSIITRSMLIEVPKKKKTSQRKTLYSAEREGAIIGGTETKFKAEEQRGGYQSPYESQQPPAA